MIPFSPPYINNEIIREVTEALQSGWITTGPKTKQFERELAAYCGVNKVICLNSATAGLELMLRWFGIGEGDEVIVPAYTYAATANVVLHCGATPVMVDVDKNCTLDLAHVEQAITSRTKAIIPVDVFGFPVPYNELMALVKKPEVKARFHSQNERQEKLGRIMVLVDAAHSVGAVYKGKKIGAQADAMVFSFHAVKNLTTAEGGAICIGMEDCFDSEEIYKQLNIKSLHGQTKDALSKQGGNWRYDIIEAGYKFNMPDILGAIGLATLRFYDSHILPRRREIFERYAAHFRNTEWADMPEFETEDRTSSYHVFPLRIQDISEAERDEIIQKLYAAGVSANVHFQPLPMLSLYKNLGYKVEDYPVAYENYYRKISLPVYPHLTDEQVDKVVTTLIGIVENEYVKKAV
jgi:dTDP-4-amino-4,6-dideoxygalactose transaminase